LSHYHRINKDLQSESGLLKRKAPLDSNNSSNGPPVRKVRPSNAENEADIQTLEKEIRALHWLARRKEQEWDQVRRPLPACTTIFWAVHTLKSSADSLSD
jgi:hypothetical protein